jgi:hypothetical protein
MSAAAKPSLLPSSSAQPETSAPQGADLARSDSDAKSLGSTETRPVRALNSPGSGSRGDRVLAPQDASSPGEHDGVTTGRGRDEQEVPAAHHQLAAEASTSSVDRASTVELVDSALSVASSDEVPKQSPPVVQSQALRGRPTSPGGGNGVESAQAASARGRLLRTERPPLPEESFVSASATDLQRSQQSHVGAISTHGGPSDPELRRMKALHAARQSARRRPPAGSNSAAGYTGSSSGLGSAGSTSSDSAASDAAVGDTGEELRQLHAAHLVELQSLRRNNIENLKKVAEERDMFAAQLAQEQAHGRTSASAKKQIADLTAQLRAARIRTADMQEELARLQAENKQLYFRVQANKTLHAEADSYSKIVEDLVNVKIQCAQLEEEKEEYRRASREISSSIAILTEANGDLEKSRAEWVVQCADLQREKDELEKQLAELKRSNAGTLSTRSNDSPPVKRESLATSPDASFSGVPLD